MSYVYIYSLSCPKTGQIRYVGKTNNLKKRLFGHLSLSRKPGKKTHVQCWIGSLLNESINPIIEMLDKVPTDEWVFWEEYWISQIKYWGFELTNKTNGGDGVDPETNMGRVLSDEHKKKISDSVKQTHKNRPLYNLTETHFKNTVILDKDELYKKYILENLSQPKCAEYFNVSETAIFKNLKKYGIKKDKSIWRKQCKNNRKSKIVLQFDLDGNFLKEWESVKLIADSFGIKPNFIRRCIKGHRKSAKGFKWGYKDE